MRHERSTRDRRRAVRRVVLGGAVAAGLLLSVPAFAGAPPSYDHDGDLDVTLDPLLGARGLWRYDVDTRTSNPGVVNPQERKAEVVVAVPSFNTISLLPPVTTADTSTASALARYTLGSVAAPGGQMRYVGTVHVDGVADANPRYVGESFSSAVSGLKLQTRARGNAGWVTRAGARVEGRATQTVKGRAMGKDPIGFEVRDASGGESVTGEILSIPWSIEDGAWQWQDDQFSMTAWNGEFHILLSSPYVTQAGSLDLMIAEGLVTTADDSGIFDGMLAGVSVGQPGSVAFALPCRIDFDWDFSPISGSFGGPEAELEYWLNLYNEGAALETEAPEPAGLAIVLMAAPALLRRRSR